MSLNGAIYIGTGAMDAYTAGLQTISNNVANLNTPGYKELTTNFSDLFSEGGGELDFTQDPNGQGLGDGVAYAPSTIDFTQGTLSSSSGDLDMGIQGAGFLVLLNGSNTLYTTTGSFTVDQAGNVVEQGTGYDLGVLNSAGEVVPLNISNMQTNPAVATTNITFADNLSSSATSDTVSDITVYDSTGAAHTWQVALAPDSNTPGEWNVTVTDETGATVGTGTITFNGSTIESGSSTITINTTYSGASPTAVTLDFSNVTSFSTGTSSTLAASQVNGNAAGTLTSVTVNSSGQIQLAYTNDQTSIAGTVAMANFLDPQVLQESSDGTFTNPTGARAELSSSGVNGFGTIMPQELEASNVDLTQEFGELILIQRGYQAASQVVSIANDMIQYLFGIRGQG